MRSSKKVLYAPTRGACDAGGVRPAECREEKGRQAARSVTQGFSFFSNVDKITTIRRTDVSGKAQQSAVVNIVCNN